MTKIKRTEITVETVRMLKIKVRRRASARWCDGCGGEVSYVHAEEAAALSGLDVDRLARLLRAGQLHAIETPDKILLVCAVSLLEVMRAES